MKEIIKNLSEPVETALNCLGIVVGINEIETILGIFLLVLNISILVIKGVFKLLAWYKTAKADGKITKEELEEAIDILEETKDSVDKEKGE